MIEPVITSFGKGQWYPKGIERLKKSCDQFGVKCTPFLNYPLGSPTHEQIPYAFKIHCMEAVRHYHNVVLWADSSVWLMNDPKPIFDIIKEQGYIIFDNFGNNNAHWCNDRQLGHFGYGRGQKCRCHGCQGSRHDQSILSLIAAQRGLTITDQNKFFTFDPTQKDCIFALQGM